MKNKKAGWYLKVYIFNINSQFTVCSSFLFGVKNQLNEWMKEDFFTAFNRASNTTYMWMHLIIIKNVLLSHRKISVLFINFSWGL